jgi:hypothetical protein
MRIALPILSISKRKELEGKGINRLGGIARLEARGRQDMKQATEYVTSSSGRGRQQLSSLFSLLIYYLYIDTFRRETEMKRGETGNFEKSVFLPIPIHLDQTHKRKASRCWCWHRAGQDSKSPTQGTKGTAQGIGTVTLYRASKALTRAQWVEVPNRAQKPLESHTEP